MPDGLIKYIERICQALKENTILTIFLGLPEHKLLSASIIVLGRCVRFLRSAVRCDDVRPKKSERGVCR